MRSAFVSLGLATFFCPLVYDFSDTWSHPQSEYKFKHSVFWKLIVFPVTTVESENAFAELYYSKSSTTPVDKSTQRKS